MASFDKSPIKRIRELLILDKVDVRNLYVYAIFAGLINLSLPLGIQGVINFVQSGQITTSWIVLIIMVLSAVIFSGSLQILQFRIIENIQQRIFVRYSFQFAYSFPRFHRGGLKDKIPVELMNRFFDVINLQKGMAKVLLDFTATFLQIIFSLLVLSFYHPFYIAFSVLLILGLYLIFKPIALQGFKTSLDESAHKYKTVFWLQEIARADWSFRLVPNGNLSLSKLNLHTSNYLNSREAHFRLLKKQYIWMIAIRVLIVASLLALGGYLVITQQMNLGQFVAAEVLILLIISSVEKFSILLETLYDVSTSLEKINQVTDLPLSMDDVDESSPYKTIFPLELIKIQSDSIDILLKIEESKHVEISCKNQQQAAKILRTLIDPSVSEIIKPRWNGKTPSIQQIASQYTKIGWFAKGSHLLEASLIDNITLGRTFVSEEMITKSMKTVGIDHLLNRFPEGLNFMLTKANKVLSEEERELILIARAIVDSPELLLISLSGLAIEKEEKTLLLERIIKNYPTVTVVSVSSDNTSEKFIQTHISNW